MPQNPASTLFCTGCKINLYLALTGVREDGYHTIESLLYPLDEPHDTLRCTPGGPEGELVLCCPGRTDLEGPSNILHKTWTLLGAETGRFPGVRIELEKQVPEGAGLGGGSANAAAFLQYLLGLPGMPVLPEEKLVRLAARIGADVPFFLKNVPAFASGIGEILRPADISLAGLWLLLVFPKVSISTRWAYAAWDQVHCTTAPGQTPKNPELLYQMQTQGLTSPHPAYTTPPAHDLFFYNSFEDVVFHEYPHLRRIKESLWINGAVAALMSGSGSCIFGLFDSEQSGKKAIRALHEQDIATSLQRL